MLPQPRAAREEAALRRLPQWAPPGRGGRPRRRVRPAPPAPGRVPVRGDHRTPLPPCCPIVLRYLDPTFVEQAGTLTLVGPPGLGKITAIRVATKLVQLGYTARTAQRLASQRRRRRRCQRLARLRPRRAYWTKGAPPTTRPSAPPSMNSWPRPIPQQEPHRVGRCARMSLAAAIVDRLCITGRSSIPCTKDRPPRLGTEEQRAECPLLFRRQSAPTRVGRRP